MQQSGHRKEEKPLDKNALQKLLKDKIESLDGWSKELFYGAAEKVIVFV